MRGRRRTACQALVTRLEHVAERAARSFSFRSMGDLVARSGSARGRARRVAEKGGGTAAPPRRVARCAAGIGTIAFMGGRGRRRERAPRRASAPPRPANCRRRAAAASGMGGGRRRRLPLRRVRGHPRRLLRLLLLLRCCSAFVARPPAPGTNAPCVSVDWVRLVRPSRAPKLPRPSRAALRLGDSVRDWETARARDADAPRWAAPRSRSRPPGIGPPPHARRWSSPHPRRRQAHGPHILPHTGLHPRTPPLTLACTLAHRWHVKRRELRSDVQLSTHAPRAQTVGERRGDVVGARTRADARDGGLRPGPPASPLPRTTGGRFPLPRRRTGSSRPSRRRPALQSRTAIADFGGVVGRGVPHGPDMCLRIIGRRCDGMSYIDRGTTCAPSPTSSAVLRAARRPVRASSTRPRDVLGIAAPRPGPCSTPQRRHLTAIAVPLERFPHARGRTPAGSSIRRRRWVDCARRRLHGCAAFITGSARLGRLAGRASASWRKKTPSRALDLKRAPPTMVPPQRPSESARRQQTASTCASAADTAQWKRSSARRPSEGFDVDTPRRADR